jgi:hypothetical protein
MSRDLERRRHIELWISWVRLIAVPFTVIEVGFLSSGYSPGYERWAWIVTSALAVGAGVIWLIARRELSPRGRSVLAYSALAFDVAIVGAFVIIFYAWEPNTPIRQALFLPVAEGAVRFGIAGGLVVPLLLAPFLAYGETLRADRYGREFNLDAVAFPLGLEMLMGLLVGWLAARLQREATSSRPSTGPRARSHPRSSRTRRSTASSASSAGSSSSSASRSS